MSFEFSDGDLRCRDCDAEIDRIQYRRKVPRCDRCEGDVWQSALSDQVDSWNRAAFEQRSRP
jgi:hypothetical protein